MNTKLIFLLLLSLGTPFFVNAQLQEVADPTPFATTITQEDLKKHLTILASDEMEGRETGTAGNEKAAQYIANQFKQNCPTGGQKCSFLQPITISKVSWNAVSLAVNGKNYRNLYDFYTFPTQNSNRALERSDEVLFLGYGIDDAKYSDYKGVDVKDKVILIYDGEPYSFKDSLSLISGTKTPSDWTKNTHKKLAVAKEKGAKLVLIIDPFLQKNIADNRPKLFGTQVYMGEDFGKNTANAFFISSTIAKEILGKKLKKVTKARDYIRKKGKNKSVAIKNDFSSTQTQNVTTTRSHNILGFIEGTDPKLKDEIVIVTAHMDHLGKRGDEIFHGADDDGSGTVSVLEINQAFAEAKKQGIAPRRSVLTMLVTGEEKGLLGSQYYAEKPIFPLKNTVADVNIDMVGRIDEAHKDKQSYIYVIGADKLSSELDAINTAMNERYTKMELDYTYNDPADPNRFYYRSDHYNFAEKGIPVVFYFNGVHEDYHRTTDTVDKINFEMLEKRAKLAFFVAWQLANQDKRIIVDSNKE